MPNTTIWRTALLLLLLLAISPSWLSAQTTFTVTVGDKTPSNPYFGMGSNQTYYIDGVEAKQLIITRGQTYVFQMSNVPTFHPFYLTTSDVGEGLGQYDLGVVGNLATQNQALTFTPSASAPDFLFYQCAAHTYMGWQILIQEAAGITDGPDNQAAISTWPNPFDDEATVALTLPRSSHVRVALFDMFGYEVRRVHDGTIEAGAPHAVRVDGAGLPSGVYELRIVGDGFARAEKIVLAR